MLPVNAFWTAPRRSPIACVSLPLCDESKSESSRFKRASNSFTSSSPLCDTSVNLASRLAEVAFAAATLVSRSSILLVTPSTASAKRRSHPRASPSSVAPSCCFTSFSASDNRDVSLIHSLWAFSRAEPMRPICASVDCCTSIRKFRSLVKATSTSRNLLRTASMTCWCRFAYSCLSSALCCCCRCCSWLMILSLDSKICCKEESDVLHSATTPRCSSQSSFAALMAVSCTFDALRAHADSASSHRLLQSARVLRKLSLNESTSPRIESKVGANAAKRASCCMSDPDCCMNLLCASRWCLSLTAATRRCSSLILSVASMLNSVRAATSRSKPMRKASTAAWFREAPVPPVPPPPPPAPSA
mmetsp:Transcript_32081/g.73296  ORF Transcript_32081/g.73296 Transcript_32081/m.73296 type:complete len:360 (-) Transcript_32081:838-1917(-)